MKKIFISIIFLIFILVGEFIYYLIFKNNSPRLILEPRDLETKLLNKFTIDKKIGQLFIIGIRGDVLNSETERLIKEMHPGGILLMSENIKNPDQLKNLVSSLQRLALQDTGLPLFIAVDQEGGLVSRIEWAEKTPQYEIENQEQAYKIGEARGKDLKTLGINLNLAPLLDITSPGDFLFERSFQENAEKIGELSKALILGQKKAGLFSALKHFPGYGGISFNPEDKLAYLARVPDISQFKKANEALSEFIMISNVVYKDFDDETPFSFLAEGIDFLKQEIKGNYIIVSDDLDQYSLLDKFPLKEIVSLPFNAGVDIIIFSGWRLASAEGIEAFKKSVEEGKVSPGRINQSVLKIINLKQELLKISEF